MPAPWGCVVTQSHAGDGERTLTENLISDALGKSSQERTGEWPMRSLKSTF